MHKNRVKLYFKELNFSASCIVRLSKPTNDKGKYGEFNY